MAPMAWACPRRGTSRRYTTAKMVARALTAALAAWLAACAPQLLGRERPHNRSRRSGRLLASADGYRDGRGTCEHLWLTGYAARHLWAHSLPVRSPTALIYTRKFRQREPALRRGSARG